MDATPMHTVLVLEDNRETRQCASPRHGSD